MYWKKLIESFEKVYRAYGGYKAILKSPYLHISFLVTLVILIYNYNSCNPFEWYKLPLAVLPSSAGFSLAAYAVALTLGSEKFLDLIRGDKKEDSYSQHAKSNEYLNVQTKVGEQFSLSPYIRISANLAHFVLVQFITLIFAIVGSSLKLSGLIIDFIGTLLFLYSLCLGLAATLSVFFLSQMYDKMPKD